MFRGFKADGVNHVMGAPLIEIHGITVHLKDEENLDTKKDLIEIFGSIEITNGRGDIHHLYDQPREAFHRILSGDTLFLQDRPPICSPFPVTMIKFHLIDKNKGRVLADDTLILDYSDKCINFEEIGDEVIYGKDGYVKVSFTTFESAVMANLDFELTRKNDIYETIRDAFVVVGTIEASYESKYSFSNPVTVTFLYVEPGDPLLVKCRQSMRMYKTKMAVPVYSSLKISASFTDIMIDGSVTCPVQSAGFKHHELMGSGDYYFQLFVNWVSGNQLRENVQEKVNGYEPPRPSRVRGLPLFLLPNQIQEVYSFAIFPDEKLNSNEVVNLHGQIDFVTTRDKFCLFKRAKSCPISFRRDQHKTFTVNIPYRFWGDHWSKLQVKLMDTKGHIFCEGFISWHPDVVFGNISWYDRFLCSTIHGEYGLVKVYHSFFTHGVPALVKVVSYFDDPCRELDTYIGGSIVSRYDRYAYDCRYYEDNFQNVLFSESRGSCSKISIGCKKQLPLLKSVIAVPYDSDLIIEVDLCLSLEVDNPMSDPLKEVIKFEVGCEGSQKSSHKIRTKDFVFEVFVDWPDFSAFR